MTTFADSTTAHLATLNTSVLMVAATEPAVTMLISKAVVADQLALRFVEASGDRRVPGDLIERAAVSVPIAPAGGVTESTVFEAPAGGAHLALATYGLVLDQLRFERTTAGWSLTVVLNAAVPAGTTMLDDNLRVALRYNIAGTGAQNELSLPEVTRDGTVVRAVVRSTDQAEQDRVFQALTDASWGSALVVARTVTYAIPIEVAVDGGDDVFRVRRLEKLQWFDRPIALDRQVSAIRPDLHASAVFRLARPVDLASEAVVMRRQTSGGDVGDIPIRPRPRPDQEPLPGEAPKMETRYRVVTSTFEHTVAPAPFVFPVATNPAVYVGIAGGGVGGITMIAHTVDGNLYIQESEGSPTFYYLPDDLRLARGAFAPHAPLMTLSYVERDGDTGAMIDPEAIVATLDFDVVPYVSGERLERAKAGLVQAAPPPYRTGATEPVLVPLRPRNDHTHLTVGLASDAPPSALSTPVIDLVKGFRCRLELPVKQFRPVYDAMFAPQAALFHGAVEVTLTDVQGVTVPFSGRLGDAFCPTSLLDVSDVAEDPSGRLTATVKNALESVVHADQLRLVARHGEDDVAAALVDPAGAVSLPSAGTIPVVMSVPAGSGVTSVGFAVGGLSVDLDPGALYEAILDRTTPVAWARPIEVNVARTLLDGVAVLQVDLDGADAISITTPEAGSAPYLPAVNVTLHQPMKSVLVGSEVSTDVRYRLRRILADGSKEPWTDYATDDTGGESLFISALPPTTATG